MFASSHSHTDLQTFETIEPMDALAIDRPALSTQDDPDALGPKPRARHCDLADAQPERGLLLRAPWTVPRRPTELRQGTGPPNIRRERRLKPRRQRASLGGP